MNDVKNTVSFLVHGSKAIFTDPVTKTGGERHTYPVPTYDALRGVLESVYWKPSIRWVIHRVRIMTPIVKESESIRLPKYTTGETDRSYNTYLRDVAYQVEASFEWTNHPGYESDRNHKKHLEIARRSIQRGGRYDIYLGGRECQAYVEPCQFGAGRGAYDYTPTVTFGLMFHGYTYPEMCGESKLYARFWDAVMENGVITFPRPEECKLVRFVRAMAPKKFISSKPDSDEAIPPEIHIPADLPQPAILDKSYPIQSAGDKRSWAGKLCETFDNLVQLDRERKGASSGLLYPGFITKTVQFELTLDADGNLVSDSIRQVPTEEADTILPCSPTSQFRTGSKKDPHLLFDYLEYLAADYPDYIEDSGDSHRLYMNQLNAWCASEARHPYVDIIRTYLVKGTLMADLDVAGVLPITKHEAGKQPPARWPQASGSGLVRFKIQMEGLPPEIWNDRDFWDSACQFNSIQVANEPKDICYVTGETAWPAPLHPYLRGTTKLISAGDKTDFTYRYGVRDLPQDYLQVSYDASQKIHLALRWLLANQSFRVGEQTYVVWSTHNMEIPKILLPGPAIPADEDNLPDVTGSKFAACVHDYALGFLQDLPEHNEVVLLSLATPTTGRTAITQYESISGSAFLDNLSRWYCATVARLPVKGGFVYRAPTPFEVANVVCGTSQNATEHEKITRQVLDAMILARKLPRRLPTLMVATVIKQFVSGEADRTCPVPANFVPLNITVGVVRKYLNDLASPNLTSHREVWGMAIDEESIDRSYLLGRLLAYCYRLENLGQYVARNGYHTTSAENLMHQYYHRPAYVLKLLNQKLTPYRNRLQRVHYGRAFLAEVDAFYAGLSPETLCDKPLNEAFILGYHAQLNEFSKNKGVRNNEDSAE